MYVDAIERIKSYIRPIHSIARFHGHAPVVPGSATLFFVNEDGFAVTCRHVAINILRSAQINAAYRRYKGMEGELRNHPDRSRLMRDLQTKFNIQDGTIKQLHNRFINCVDGDEPPVITPHPNEHVDLALVQFKNFRQRLYTGYATFLKDTSRIKPGRTLCRIGYPFPDFTNFRYNPRVDDIEWSEEPTHYVSFPIDGIITRLLPNKKGIVEIEMSTPGLVGQSGGPLFDAGGLVNGMQSATDQLHLGLDIEDREVLVKNRRSLVSNYPFLNVGICIHADQIKAFLRDNGVKFYEA